MVHRYIAVGENANNRTNILNRVAGNNQYSTLNIQFSSIDSPDSTVSIVH